MEVLFSKEQINSRVYELAEEISRDYKQVNLLCVLKGSFIFSADLARALSAVGCETRIEFIKANSYNGTRSTGDVEISFFTGEPGLEYLIVEDIVDTGRTLKALKEYLGPGTKVCALLDKPSRRVVDMQADYVGFTIEDRFVVGYGLDCDEEHRELDHLAVMDC